MMSIWMATTVTSSFPSRRSSRARGKRGSNVNSAADEEEQEEQVFDFFLLVNAGDRGQVLEGCLDVFDGLKPHVHALRLNSMA